MAHPVVRAMEPSTVYRIAISQIIILLALVVVYVCLGVYTLYDDDEETGVVLQRGFYVCGFLYAVPLVLAISLLYGLIKKSSTILRYWIMLSLIETVIVFATSLGGSIYFAQFLDIYYGIPLIAIQVIVAMWKLECIVVINKYYREELVGDNKHTQP